MMKTRHNLNEEELKARQIVDDCILNLRTEEYRYVIEHNSTLASPMLGSINEYHFFLELESTGKFDKIYKPDDRDKKEGKSDLMANALLYGGRQIRFQSKAIQTSSIRFKNGKYYCKVQNDGSDRKIKVLPNGHEVNVTNSPYGEYDILVTCLMPLTDEWKFAYKLNSECSNAHNSTLSEEDRKYLMATSENLEYPFEEGSGWTTDIDEIVERLVKKSPNECVVKKDVVPKQLFFSLT